MLQHDIQQHDIQRCGAMLYVNLLVNLVVNPLIDHLVNFMLNPIVNRKVNPIVNPLVNSIVNHIVNPSCGKAPGDSAFVWEGFLGDFACVRNCPVRLATRYTNANSLDAPSLCMLVNMICVCVCVCVCVCACGFYV